MFVIALSAATVVSGVTACSGGNKMWPVTEFGDIQLAHRLQRCSVVEYSGRCRTRPTTPFTVDVACP